MLTMQDIPSEIIKKMDYKERMRRYQQELTEKLQTMGQLPLYEYDQMIRSLCEKWRV